MPNFLPPVVVEILAKADQAYTTLDKVSASAMKSADKVIAEARKQADAQVLAASKADAAAQASADKAAAAAEKYTLAVAKRVEAEEKAAQITAEAEGQVTAAVEKAVAAVERAKAREAKAFDASSAAATKASDMQIAAAEKASAAEEAQAKIVEAQSAKRMTMLKAAGDTAGKIGTIGAASVALVAGVAGEMAAKFEQSTTKLVTSAGESTGAIDEVRQGILQISSNIGVSADELSNAMYKVESAGYHSAAGLGVLKAATEGARAEGADATNVADALSSALRDYYPHAQSAADVTAASTDVMSKFIGATSSGKMTFDDLAGSLNSILPVSSAAKISLSDTLGVLASMTVHGISAEQATQNMADAIRHLQAPTQVMAKAMATLGVDSTEVAQKLGERGLSGTMQFLSEKVKAAMPPGTEKVIIDLGNALSKSSPAVQELGQQLMDGSISLKDFTKAAKEMDPISAGQAQQFATLAKSTHMIGNEMISGEQVLQTYGGTMAKVMGDATGLKVALMTTGENADYTNESIKTIMGSTADADGKVKGYAESQGTLATSLDKAKASLANAAIALGTALTPAIKVAAEALTGFTSWAQQNPKLLESIVIAVAALSGVLLVFAGVMAIVNLVMAPEGLIVLAIVAAIAVLITIIVLLVTHWNEVVKFITDVWNGFLGWMRDVINGFVGWWNSLWGGFGNWIKSVWQGFTSWVTNLWNGFLNGIRNLLTPFISAIQAIWDGYWNGPFGKLIINVFRLIQVTIQFVIAWIAEYIKTYISMTVDFWVSVWTHVADFFTTVWNGIVSFVTTVAQAVYNAVSGPMQAIGDTISSVLDWIGGIWSAAWNGYWSTVSSIWNSIVGGVSGGVNNVMGSISGLGGQILAALGALASQAFNSGVSIVTGIANGIMSAVGQVADAIGNIVQTISDHMPHSPAKRGPLSGQGYTLYSGQALVRDFARGMVGNAHLVDAASAFITSNVQVGGALSFAGGGSAPQYVTVSGASPAPVSRGGGNVTVYAQTNASPHQIASEVGWALRNQN